MAHQDLERIVKNVQDEGEITASGGDLDESEANKLSLLLIHSKLIYNIYVSNNLADFFLLTTKESTKQKSKKPQFRRNVLSDFFLDMNNINIIFPAYRCCGMLLSRFVRVKFMRSSVKTVPESQPWWKFWWVSIPPIKVKSIFRTNRCRSIPTGCAASGHLNDPSELNPVPDLSVSENLFHGARDPEKPFLGDWASSTKKNKPGRRKRYTTVWVSEWSQNAIRSLSVAQVQLVEITKAISLSSPSLYGRTHFRIDGKGSWHLFEQITKLRKNGVGIIYISHKLDEVFAISDRISVLRDGDWSEPSIPRNYAW